MDSKHDKVIQSHYRATGLSPLSATVPGSRRYLHDRSGAAVTAPFELALEGESLSASARPPTRSALCWGAFALALDPATAVGFAVAGRRSLFRDLDSGLRDDERGLIQLASFPCDVATDDLVDQQIKVDIIFPGDPLESGEALGIDTIGDVNSGLKGFRVHT